MVDVLDWEVVDVVVAVTAPGVEETAGVADCDFDADIEREEEELMEAQYFATMLARAGPSETGKPFASRRARMHLASRGQRVSLERRGEGRSPAASQ